MGDLSRYSGVDAFLDRSPEYENIASEITVHGQRFLIVTQVGKDGGGQVLFRREGNEFVFVKRDTVVDLSPDETFFAGVATHIGGCGPSSTDEHAKVAAYAAAQVGHFSSATGPDGGNLACCWAVRYIVHAALGRWITRTDGTGEFGTELAACFGHVIDEASVPDGGIIISPTGSGSSHSLAHGHVGILGPRSAAGDRIVYSNSSADAMWEQNWTVSRWSKHYGDEGKLQVLFYPLPKPGQLDVS